MRQIMSYTKAVWSGVPPGAALLAVSAVLFLAGSGSLSRMGAHGFAQFGIIGAAVAAGIALTFCNWRRH